MFVFFDAHIRAVAGSPINCDSIPDRGNSFLFSPKHPNRLRGPPSLLLNRYRDRCEAEHPDVVPKLRLFRDVLQFSHMNAVNRNNFSLYVLHALTISPVFFTHIKRRFTCTISTYSVLGQADLVCLWLLCFCLRLTLFIYRTGHGIVTGNECLRNLHLAQIYIPASFSSVLSLSSAAGKCRLR
jgi:hypothetical protein